jgi:Cof subfamily protein (haloacid dehalogenase superfamily)
MDLSKVKLVVTDMDGTLLNSKGQVSADFFQIYKQLKEHDIHFVAASGRQYQSIINKLHTIQDEIFIVAENGGLTVKGDKELHSVTLSPKKVQELIPILRKIENVYTVLCGKRSAYIETKEERFVSMFNEYYTKYQIVDDLTKVVDDEFFKIAIYSFECSEKFIYPSVKHFEDELQVKVSGENWVDISNSCANKGNALKFIQDRLGITKEETIVFGDYNNDLEMLEQAHFSYAMANAHPNVKKASRFITKSNDDAGVEIVLEKLLVAKNLG